MTSRSKLKLDLPQLNVRPPVPPRAYKKVFDYIQSTTSAPSTPNRGAAKYRDDIAKTPVSTPSKLSRSGLIGTPKTSNTGTPLSKRRRIEDEEAPEWVMPAIRALCKAFNRPDAAPHVFAGVSSVLKLQRDEVDTPSRKRQRKFGGDTPPTSRAKVTEQNMTALISVITFYTLAELDEAPETEEYIRQRRLAIKTLTKFDPQGPRDKDGITADIESFMREAQNGWLDMQWYQNILKDDEMNGEAGVNGSLGLEGELADDEEALPKTRRRNGTTRDDAPVLRGGFGTMFNDSTDWLSDERRADYVRWKSRILSEIEKVEKYQPKGKHKQRTT